jgi:hypothetical protein
VVNRPSDIETHVEVPAEVAAAFAQLRRDSALRREVVLDRVLRTANTEAAPAPALRWFPLRQSISVAAAFTFVASVSVLAYMFSNSPSPASKSFHVTARTTVPGHAPNGGGTWLERTLETAPDGATIRVGSDVASGPITVSKPIRLVAGDRGVRIGVTEFEEVHTGSSG